MENYINIFIATLVHLEQLTEDEGKRLAKKISTSTIPSTYDEVKELVELALQKAKEPVKVADEEAVKAANITEDAIKAATAVVKKKR